MHGGLMRLRLSLSAIAIVSTLVAIRPADAATAPPLPEPTPSDAAYAALRDSALASAKCADATGPVGTFEPQPQYGPALRRQRIRGVVILEGIILADGSIAYPRVLRADNPALIDPSLSAFRTYRYKPATCAGKRVPRFVTVTHTFRLQ